MPFFDLFSRHARREAAREHISLEDVESTYLWPDEIRESDHDDEREIRTRYFGSQVIEVVVDRIDGRVVTVWRKGEQR